MPAVTGELKTYDGDTWLSITRHLPLGLADAWRALTDPGELEKFIGYWTGDPRSGVVDFYMSAEAEPGQDIDPSPYQILECKEPQRYVVESNAMGLAWRCSIDLDSRGEYETEVRFGMRILAGMELENIGPGWEYYMDRLVAVQTGRSVAEVDWDTYYPALAAEYDALPSPR